MGLSCASLKGAAWTQGQGQGQIILNFSFMDSSRWFDSSRKLQSFSDHGSFRQVAINPYVEYGLNSKTTLVLNTFVSSMKYANDFGSASSSGLGDTELGSPAAVDRRIPDRRLGAVHGEVSDVSGGPHSRAGQSPDRS